jgi:hypothetical protein
VQRCPRQPDARLGFGFLAPQRGILGGELRRDGLGYQLFGERGGFLGEPLVNNRNRDLVGV